MTRWRTKSETIPPYENAGKSYPMGRVFRGSVPDFHVDNAFARMTEAQAVQPPIYADTSWLLVGHIDETMSFVKMNNPRGWGVALNDPAMAKKMLEDLVAQGHGDTLLFTGKFVWNNRIKKFRPRPA
jgi:protein-arginine deiminase